jgi:hypothetical protein
MKITRNELKNLIIEELRSSQSVLLEMPGMGGGPSYRNDEEDGNQDEVDLTSQNLYHMARKCDQLHDMLKGDEKLSDEFKDEVEACNRKISDIFDAVLYDKQNPPGT